MMGRSDPHFIYPQFRRLVWMDVVHGAGEADDQAVVDGDGDVVPGIGQELPRQVRVHRIVEHRRRHAHQDRLIAALQNLDRDGHGPGPSRRLIHYL